MNRNGKIEELNERTLKILESTKKEMEKYAPERKSIFQYSCKKINSNLELEQWENELKKMEREIHIRT